MLFSKNKGKKRNEKVEKIPGIEREGVEALKELGYENTSSLAGEDAEKMYYELSARRGDVADKSILFQFRCAIYYSTVKKADPKKLHWWYWKDSSANDDVIGVEDLIEMYKSTQQ